MSKMIIVFLAIFAVVFLVIQGVTAASGREKLQLAKVLGYSLACATLVIAIVSAIVILF
jgi:cytochrome c oxidase assembly factor CtaG